MMEEYEAQEKAFEAVGQGAPIDMLLYCPQCGWQHIDKPDPEGGWLNPPHRSHLCGDCGCIWRPADVPTNGVPRIATKGAADSWRVTELMSATAAVVDEAPAEAREVLAAHAGYEISRWDVQENCSVLAKHALTAMQTYAGTLVAAALRARAKGAGDE